MFIACSRPAPTPEPAPRPSTHREVGRAGGRLVVALAAEPKTLNPAKVADLTSRAVVHRLHADLVRIDRQTQQAVPELAESWTVTEDGRRYTLKLRHGLLFSDGHPCDADDVVFSFQVYLDEQVASPQRSLLLVGGQPVTARKIDTHTVEIELAAPYAAAERLFDGFAILPRHLLQEAYAAGRLGEAWGLTTAPSEIAGLGPFRLREVQPGERLVLERNPYYWKRDAAEQKLPYLDELVMLITSNQEAQALRFRAGELDAIDRIAPEDFAAIEQSPPKGYRLDDLGAGLDLHFLFFNLNDLTGKHLATTSGRQRWFRQLAFRQAVRQAIDLDAIVRLAFQGRATALASHVTPGDRHWLNPTLEPPRRSVAGAREQLAGAGFRWDPGGRLIDARNQPVEFSLLSVVSAPQTTRAATLIQSDLSELGIEVQVAALELGAISERLFSSFDYEAVVLGLGGGSGGPNPAMNLLLSTGKLHFWRLGQAQPVEPWQAEIDRLMVQQATELDPRARQLLYHRVQEIIADKVPFLPLVSPNVLVGATVELGNFRPANLPHHVLWNSEELYWKTPTAR